MTGPLYGQDLTSINCDKTDKRADSKMPPQAVFNNYQDNKIVPTSGMKPE
jgi:hypothetical protein